MDMEKKETKSLKGKMKRNKKENYKKEESDKNV